MFWDITFKTAVFLAAIVIFFLFVEPKQIFYTSDELNQRKLEELKKKITGQKSGERKSLEHY